jgi:hypothetical protein
VYVLLLTALHNHQGSLKQSGLSFTQYSHCRQLLIIRLRPAQQTYVDPAMVACSATSGGALPAAVQFLPNLRLVCCAHISCCVAQQAWLRLWDFGPDQQPVLLFGQRLDVCSKLQSGLQVLLAVQQLDISLRSTEGERFDKALCKRMDLLTCTAQCTNSAAESGPLHPSIQVLLQTRKPCFEQLPSFLPSTGQTAHASAHIMQMLWWWKWQYRFERWHLRQQARMCMQVRQRKQHAVVDAPGAAGRPCGQCRAKAQELQRSRCCGRCNESARMLGGVSSGSVQHHPPVISRQLRSLHFVRHITV